MAHPKHTQVRARFNYRCAYCGVSEADVGSELTVDHFRPVSVGGDDEDLNLVYACHRCNLLKADFYPDKQDLAMGRRVLHPMLDDVSKHIRENLQTGRVEPLTETGAFHIALLDLNRPPLVNYRLRRNLITLLVKKQRLLEAENAQLRSLISRHQSFLRGFPTRLDQSDKGET